jgi:hypothetical protein
MENKVFYRFIVIVIISVPGLGRPGRPGLLPDRYTAARWPGCAPASKITSLSNELTRGPTESVQHVYRGSSHRRKSAACPKFDMVWQYRSPIPVGRRRGIISSSNDFYLPSLREEGSAPGGFHEAFELNYRYGNVL